MAKFKKGDWVRCVSDVTADVHIGKVYLVDGYEDGRVYFKDDDGCDRHRSAYRYELATPSPIPDTVTIGGVEYVRKPDPEHVWAWGQWARVNKSADSYCVGEIVFVTGPVKDNGFVPITYKDCDGMNHTDGCLPTHLTYIGTADIPR